MNPQRYLNRKHCKQYNCPWDICLNEEYCGPAQSGLVGLGFKQVSLRDVLMPSLAISDDTLYVTQSSMVTSPLGCTGGARGYDKGGGGMGNGSVGDPDTFIKHGNGGHNVVVMFVFTNKNMFIIVAVM